ncbi:hypothetical protein MKX01_014128 [Papaver californicum]|nr:hypothetical protein MKX01_014128 [Papaver californicum]
MVAYLRKQSPGRSTLAGTSLWESLYGSVQRIGGATSADGRKHRITIAMLSEKRVNPEIEAGDPLTVLAQITHFRDDWCTMCCRECWQELKNERGLERCRHCFRYVQPIPRLRLTMTVTESQGELWWRHC